MKSLFAASDYANIIDYARENGIAIGKEQGIAIQNAHITTAMLAKGMDIELICELTGLSPEEINALKQQ